MTRTITRRTVLRGVGVTMCLPWLESLPALGASRQAMSAAPGAFPKRFAVFFMGQPIKLDYVWAGLCLLGAVFFIFRSA